MLCVGVDAWNLPGDHRGVGRYLRSILHEWRQTYASRVEVVLIVPEWHTWTVRSRYRHEVCDHPYRIVSRRGHAHAGLDVLWFPFNGCSWLHFSLPAVATLHDAFAFDRSDPTPQDQAIYLAAARRCQRIITDSNAAKGALSRALGLPLASIVAIAPGVRVPVPGIALADDRKPSAPYVLFVGTSDRRKGLDTLVAAMAIVQEQRPDVRLVLVGDISDAIPGLNSIRAEVIGFVDDAMLATLYRNATVFAFPSRYEGFGLPILEAMSYGVPVVAARNTSIPEATGDAGILVETDSSEALAQALLRVLNDRELQNELRARGLERAAGMSWSTTAARTFDLLEDVARGCRR